MIIKDWIAPKDQMCTLGCHSWNVPRLFELARNLPVMDIPLILDEDGEVMDGRHRLMKAMLTGAETIKAVRFDENPSPCQVKDV